MPRLIILLIFILAIWYWWNTVKRLEPEQKRAFLWRSAFWTVLAVTVVLAVTGRMHWVGAAVAALLPLVSFLFKWGRRALPLMQILSRFKTSPSHFKTSSLSVSINFASKKMDGTVLTGEFSGKTLSELSSEELDSLATDLRENDRESYALLYAYRMRTGNSGQQAGGDFQNANFTGISEEEAYEVLGLELNASKEDVLKAHKRLMQRLHPDRGGSDYLAAKINAAKDKLV